MKKNDLIKTILNGAEVVGQIPDIGYYQIELSEALDIMLQLTEGMAHAALPRKNRYLIFEDNLDNSFLF